MIPPRKGASIASGSASIHPRYEDITQDGRLQLAALMPGLGAAAWYALQKDVPAIDSFAKRGVIPILRRLVIVGEGGPFSAHVPIDVEGHAELAREKGGERLFLNMWAEARAPLGTTFGERPGDDAERVPAGHVFAEHVITRPFAPKEERKVTRLEHPGLPALPKDEHPYEATEHLVSGVDLTIAHVVEFGMMHTDSNQHVNSLVYPRIFEEAVHRHLGAKAKNLLARALELRWRKPFFAGDRAVLRLAVVDGTAYGSFTPAGGDEHRPSCTIKMKMG